MSGDGKTASGFLSERGFVRHSSIYETLYYFNYLFPCVNVCARCEVPTRGLARYFVNDSFFCNQSCAIDLNLIVNMIAGILKYPADTYLHKHRKNTNNISRVNLCIYEKLRQVFNQIVKKILLYVRLLYLVRSTTLQYFIIIGQNSSTI